jgi:hypothetical protein
MCIGETVTAGVTSMFRLHFVVQILKYLWTVTGFQAHSQSSEKQLFASSCPCVRPSVCMEQLGSHWMDFGET